MATVASWQATEIERATLPRSGIDRVKCFVPCLCLAEGRIGCGGIGKCLKRFGGPGEIRTHDLFHAMEARSQLRHRPIEPFLQYITEHLEHGLTLRFPCPLQ